MTVEPAESEEELVAPNVAARAIPPVADAVDLEEVMPSIEQKSNIEIYSFSRIPATNIHS